MIGKDSKLVQVVISQVAYNYIKKYCKLFGGSLSHFCADAINKKIIDGEKKYFEKNSDSSDVCTSVGLCDKVSG